MLCSDVVLIMLQEAYQRVEDQHTAGAILQAACTTGNLQGEL